MTRYPRWLMVFCVLAACGSKTTGGELPDFSVADPDATDLADLTDAVDVTPTDATATDVATVPVPTAGAVTLTAGQASLVVDRDGRRLTLGWAGAARTKLDLNKLRVGRVKTWDPDWNYAPDDLAGNGPDGLSWLHVTTAEWTPHVLAGGITGVTLLLHLADDKGVSGPDYQLAIEPRADGDFRATLQPADAQLNDDLTHDKVATDTPVYVDLRAQVPASERFYGLGEYFDTPQHRGKVRHMQIVIDTSIDAGYNEAHVPIPLLIGTRGWGLFVEDRHPGIWDVAAAQADEVQALFAHHQTTFWLFAAAQPIEITGHYTSITGANVLPAKWAFGSLIWRNENKDTAEVLTDMQAIRDNDLAISGMWLDRPFDVAVNNFGFDPKKFPDPKALVDGVHAKGMRMGEWSTPYLDPGPGNPKAAHRDEAVQKGYFVTTPLGNAETKLSQWGAPIDLTNPDALAFWKSLVKQATDAGIEGWKMDYGEDIQAGILTSRTHYGFFDGSDERTMHHGFHAFYHRPYAESLPATGGWLLSRAGSFGDQVYSSIIWPGDLCANWAHHGECDADGTTCHTGGLPASVSASISLPASGYPLFGPDTGGYKHGRAGKELFLRWLQHSAFSGILQIGGGDQHNPWDFAAYPSPYAEGGVSQFDQEVLDTARYFIRLHTRLFPYIYSYAQNARDHKPGLTRALGLQFPELNDFYAIGDFEATEYAFGEDLLIAPFTQPGGKRKVLIPKGQWLDWWTHQPVGLPDAATVIDVALPLGQSPMYVRAGALIALLRPTIDTLAPTTDATVDSFAGKPGRLYVLATPGKPAARTLYDGTQLSSTALTGFDPAAFFSAQKGSDFNVDVEWQFWLDAAAAKPKPTVQGGASLSEASDDATWQTCSSCWRWDAATHTADVRVAMGTVFSL